MNTQVKDSLLNKGRVIKMDAKGNAVVQDDISLELYILSGAFLGEVIKYKQNSSKRKQRQKKVVLHSVLESPWNKIKPFCTHYKICGGCNAQELSYKDQLKIKQKYVASLFTSLVASSFNKKIPNIVELPIIGCDNHMYYRNKVDYTFGDRRWLLPNEVLTYKNALPLQNKLDLDTDRDFLADKAKSGNADLRGLGFHVKGLYDRVVHLHHCFLHKSNALRKCVHDWALENDVSYFNSRNNKGFLRMMTIRTAEHTDSTLQYMLIISFAYNDEKKIKQLCQMLTKKNDSKFQFQNDVQNISSLYIVINDGLNDTVQHLPHTLVHGKKYIEEHCTHVTTKKHLVYKIYPQVFYQTNSTQAKKLYAAIFKIAQCKNKDEVLDLYCGIGSISLYFASFVKRVVGVDLVPQSIKAAEENAKDNNIDNAYFFTLSSESAVEANPTKDSKIKTEDILQRALRNSDIVIVDPPRAGLHKKVIQYFCRQKPKVIIYVSCNPVTLVQDIKDICSNYRPVLFQTIDMFPHTLHLETIVRLERKDDV